MTMTGGTSAQAEMARWLDAYGLSSLAGWAYDQLAQGLGPEQILLDLPQRPEYQARFPAMAELAKAGRAINESQYIAYENAVRQVMRNSGLPPQFYDQPQDFAQLMVNDVSVAEVEQRVTNAYQKLAFAPPEVKDAFAQMYGPGSNDALAAFMLDPDKAQPMIQRQVAAAEAKGTGMRLGLDINQQLAEQVAQATPSGQVGEVVQRAAGMRPLSEQTVMEQQTGTGVTQEQLVKTAAGIESPTDVKKALESRVAQFQGQGGAVQSQQGVIGLGGSQK